MADMNSLQAYIEREERKRRVKKAWAAMRKNNAAAFLYDDIYNAVYYADENGRVFRYGIEIISEASAAFDSGDLYTLEQFAFMVKEPEHKNEVVYLAMKIAKVLSANNALDVEGLLSLLHNNTEAGIVYDVVRKAADELPYLPRGYNEARKRKTRRRKLTNAYEHQLRFGRHSLERLLMSEGTGINRAKRISKILTYI